MSQKHLLLIAVLFFVLLLGATGCGDSSSGGGGTPDITAPAEVTFLTAVHGDGSVALSWTNPIDDFAGVVIRRSTTAYPADETAGDEVYDGPDTTVNDISVTNATQYFYTIFTYDTSGNYSAGETRTVTPHVRVVVTFTDPNLVAAVRAALGIPAGDIYDDNCAGINVLDASGAVIDDLTGIEAFTNLTDLDLSSAGLTDGANTVLISGLINLVNLDLSKNSLAIIPGMTNLTKLEGLDLADNSIVILTPLSTLTGLKILNLRLNSITDITALSNLTGLQYLILRENSLTSLVPLSSLSNLISLNLTDCGLTSIADLDGLTGLTSLKISQNTLSNLTGMEGMTSLTQLYADYSGIIDISALAGCTAMGDLHLIGNSITDISALAACTSMYGLQLVNNNIADILPLVNNTGLGSGDMVTLTGNPLSATSINTYIPALSDRGVTVLY